MGAARLISRMSPTCTCPPGRAGSEDPPEPSKVTMSISVNSSPNAHQSRGLHPALPHYTWRQSRRYWPKHAVAWRRQTHTTTFGVPNEIIRQVGWSLVRISSGARDIVAAVLGSASFLVLGGDPDQHPTTSLPLMWY